MARFNRSNLRAHGRAAHVRAERAAARNAALPLVSSSLPRATRGSGPARGTRRGAPETRSADSSKVRSRGPPSPDRLTLEAGFEHLWFGRFAHANRRLRRRRPHLHLSTGNYALLTASTRKRSSCERRHNRPPADFEIEPCCCDDCCRSCRASRSRRAPRSPTKACGRSIISPSTLVRERYGVDIDGAWLDRVRRGTVRLAGCTASFVSPDGLLLTNHHCVASCLAQNSTRESSLLETGFIAPDRSRELDCPVQIADVLEKLENVTAAVQEATRGLDEQAANERRRQTLTELEATCEQTSRTAGNPLKCEAVTLYGGGQFWLYQYRRYDDVRLVFAPEADIAAFGGDPDNFQFPRWCLDFSLLRAYENGRPAATPQYLTIDFDGPAADEPVFVAGHPGSTDRQLTVAELRTLRDRILPPALLRASELRGRYSQFGKTDAAAQQDRAGRAVRTRERPQGATQGARRIARRRAAGGEARRGIGPAQTREPQPRARSRDRRPVGAHRGGASRGSRALAALRVPRRRRRLQQPPRPPRAHAGARRRRAAEAERRAAARIHGRLLAAPGAATCGAAADLSRAGTPDAVVLARAHARVAGPRRAGRAPAARDRNARRTRRTARRRVAARGPGRSHAVVERRPGGDRCLERSVHRVGTGSR